MAISISNIRGIASFMARKGSAYEFAWQPLTYCFYLWISNSPCTGIGQQRVIAVPFQLPGLLGTHLVNRLTQIRHDVSINVPVASSLTKWYRQVNWSSLLESMHEYIQTSPNPTRYHFLRFLALPWLQSQPPRIESAGLSYTVTH